jgi:hypothetical protein
MFRSYDACKLESWTSRPPFLGPRPLVLVQGAATALVVLVAAAMAGAAWLTADSIRPEEGVESDAYPGAGMIVRSEALHLWLPDRIGELASHPDRLAILRDYEGFRRFLERRGQETVHFAVTYRAYQVNGGRTDITFVRRPYDEPSVFQELSAILAGAGEPDRGASVHVVPEALLNREPSAMLAEMQRIVD